MAPQNNQKLNLEVAQDFVIALGGLIASGAPRSYANPREAMLMAVPEGKELGLHEEGLTRQKDVVAVAFRVGKEHEGPCNIAIYERLNNKIRINPRCSLWYRAHPKMFMIASHEDETGYHYADARLVRFGPVPRDDFDLHVSLAEAELHRAAKVARNLALNPFKRPS